MVVMERALTLLALHNGGWKEKKLLRSLAEPEPGPHGSEWDLNFQPAAWYQNHPPTLDCEPAVGDGYMFRFLPRALSTVG